jgi:hypothetical protein
VHSSSATSPSGCCTATDAENRLARTCRKKASSGASTWLERAVGIGAFTGLVAPQYLTDMYTPGDRGLGAHWRDLRRARAARVWHDHQYQSDHPHNLGRRADDPELGGV